MDGDDSVIATRAATRPRSQFLQEVRQHREQRHGPRLVVLALGDREHARAKSMLRQRNGSFRYFWLPTISDLRHPLRAGTSQRSAESPASLSRIRCVTRWYSSRLGMRIAFL